MNAAVMILAGRASSSRAETVAHTKYFSKIMSASFLVAADGRSQDASGLDGKVDLSAGESEDPSSWGGLVFGEKRKAFIQAEFTKAAGSAAGRLAIKKVRA
jgi:hypothetical protein